MIKVITLFLLLWFMPSILCQDIKTVKIGISITDSVNPVLNFTKDLEDRFISMANTLERGAMVFQHYVDEHGPWEIGGESVTFQVVIKYDDYFSPTIMSRYEEMIEDESINLFVSGFGTSPSNAAATITESKGKLIVSSTTATSYFHEGRKYSFSVYPTSLSMGSAAIPYYRMAGVKSVTFIKTINSPLPASRESCMGFEEELIKSDIKNFSYVYYDYNSTFENARSNYSAVSEEVAKLDNDLTIFCGIDGLVLMEIVKGFKERDYVPKGGLSTTIDYLLDRDLMNFWVMSSSLLITDFSPPDGTFIKNEEDFLNRLFTIYPDYKPEGIDHKLGYYSTIAFETILAGMIAANSTEDVVSIADSIRRNIYTSFVGDIYYDAQNRIMNPGIVIQYAYESHNALGPYTIANESLIYPMPTWAQRVQRTNYSAIEIVVFVFLVLSILNSIGWLIYVVYNRQKKEITANSPIFLVSMLVGSILVYISLFFWTPTHKTNVGCSLHVALLLFGFLLLFGSMVVKTWRVHLLFSQKSLKVFHISNTQVFIFLSILLVVDIILYIIWAILTKSKLVLQENRYIPYEEYYYCSSNNGGKIMIWIMVGYHVLIFIYGAYLALRVRTIPFKLYDESKIIAFCIYNVGLVAIIVAILEGTQAAERFVQFGLRSFLIILSLGITINSMFIAKTTISKNANHSSTSTDSASMSNIKSVNSDSGHTTDWEELYKKVKKENKKLKSEIKELKKANEALKEMRDD